MFERWIPFDAKNEAINAGATIDCDIRMRGIRADIMAVIQSMATE